MENIEQIYINRTYSFFNDIIDINECDSSLLKIDKKLYKNISIYNIGYITIKHISDYEKINSVNPLYLIIGEVDGYIYCNSTEESNGNKYLSFASTNKSKDILTKYTELWDKIKYLIKAINGLKAGQHGKDFMKIKSEYV